MGAAAAVSSRTGACCLFFVLLGPLPACALSQPQQAWLNFARTLPGTVDSIIVSGLVYDGAQCLDEAESAFLRALQTLGPTDSDERTEADGMLQFVRAEKFLKNGDQTAAVPMLWNIVRTIRSPNASSRATDLLARILPASDRRGWEELGRYLSDASDEFRNWNTMAVVRRKQFERDPQTAITAVEADLEKDKTPQWRAALEILLAELYSRSGRAVEAQLLLNYIEEDVGKTVTDVELRRRFLELGKQVWESAAAADPAQRDRAAAYAKLFDDFSRRLGRTY